MLEARRARAIADRLVEHVGQSEVRLHPASRSIVREIEVKPNEGPAVTRRIEEVDGLLRVDWLALRAGREPECADEPRLVGSVADVRNQTREHGGHWTLELGAAQRPEILARSPTANPPIGLANCYRYVTATGQEAERELGVRPPEHQIPPGTQPGGTMHFSMAHMPASVRARPSRMRPSSISRPRLPFAEPSSTSFICLTRWSRLNVICWI